MYNINSYNEIIRETNFYISKYKISINSLSKNTGISRQTINKIINKEQTKTKYNPSRILEETLKLCNVDSFDYNKTSLKTKNLQKRNILMYEIFSKKNQNLAQLIIYFLSIFNEIPEFNKFFNYIFYTVSSEKEQRYIHTIKKLKDNSIVSISNNILQLNRNIHYLEISKNKKTYYLNLAYKYFQKEKCYKKCYQCALYLKNNQMIENSFIKYLYKLYINNPSYNILEDMNNHFIWLKKNKKRKSKEFKIFYISLLLNFFYNNSKITTSFIYSIYFIKNIKIKENIFSKELNYNFNFQKIINLDSKNKTKNIISYFTTSSLLRIVHIYNKMNLPHLSLSLNNFLLNKINKSNIFYPYLYNYEFLFIYQYGNMDNLKKLINNISQIYNNEDMLFKTSQIYFILKKDYNKYNEISSKYLSNNELDKKHYTFINNIFENFIIASISKKDYLTSISLIIGELNTKINKYEFYIYLSIIFILILKNNRIDLLNMKCNHLFDTEKYLKLKELFKIKNIYKIKNQLSNYIEVPIKQFNSLSIGEFYYYFFKSYLSFQNKNSKKLIDLQLNFLNNCDTSIKEINNFLLSQNIINNNKKKQYDTIGTFISHFPVDNKLLKIFHIEQREEDFFLIRKYMKEFNLITNFFENYTDKTFKINFVDYLKDSKFFLSTLKYSEKTKNFIKEYFENHLNDIEIEKRIIFKKHDKKENITHQLTNIFKQDISKKQLSYTKCYLISKF